MKACWRCLTCLRPRAFPSWPMPWWLVHFHRSGRSRSISCRDCEPADAGPDGWMRADVMRGAECKTLEALARPHSKGSARAWPRRPGLCLAGFALEAGRGRWAGPDHTEPDHPGGRADPVGCPPHVDRGQLAGRASPGARHRDGRGRGAGHPGPGARAGGIPGPGCGAPGNDESRATCVVLGWHGGGRRRRSPGSPSHPGTISSGLGGRPGTVAQSLCQVTGRVARGAGHSAGRRALGGRFGSGRPRGRAGFDRPGASERSVNRY